MLCPISEVKQVKAAMLTIDMLLKKREALLGELDKAEAQKGHVLNRHGPLLFALRSVALSVGWIFILEVVFVIFPMDFHYPLLAPIFGIITEIYWKRRDSKRDKSVIKEIDKCIKSCASDISETDDKIYELYLFAKEKLDKYVGFDKPMITNTAALDYVIRDDPDDKNVSVLARSNEFVKKYENIGDSLPEIREEINASQIQAEYRKIMIKEIEEEMNACGTDSTDSTEG